MNLLVFLVGFPVMGALLAFLGAKRGRSMATWVAAVSLTCALGLSASLASSVFQGSSLEFRYPWIPYLGLEFALRLDGLSLIFCAIIFAIGLLVVLYAHYYMPQTDPLGRFLALLLLFAGAMTAPGAGR